MKRILCSLMLFISGLNAFQVRPYLGQDLLINIKPTTTLEFFHDTDVEEDPDFSSKMNGVSFFQDINVEMALFREWSVELSLGTGVTKKRDWGYDHFFVCGRYLFFSDLLGDPFSLSVGLSFQHASKDAVEDFLSYHNGRFEYAAHLAIGKEWSCDSFWTWRLWTALGFGQAERGSPWIWTKSGLESNWWDYASAGISCETRLGLANHPLNLFEPFHGYGSIGYRAVRVGGYYKTVVKYGELEFNYSYQPWERNYPKSVHSLKAELVIPFGL